jgi:5-formyltetrahydrofolate cyclo-ligase
MALDELLASARSRPVALAPLPASTPAGKVGWRAQAEARLRALNPVQRRSHAVRLAKEIGQLAQALGARVVGLYAPVGAEPETRDLAHDLLARGIRLAYPRVHADGTAMDFAASDGPSALVPRPRTRMMEPAGSVLAPSDLDLVLVPALALRGDLTRLGRGGGHFDRYLPQLRPGAVLVGAVPAACVLDWSPREDHDVAMTLVCTEAGLYGPAA